MRATEWIAIAFFAHLMAAAVIRPLPAARRVTVALGAAALIAAIVAVSRFATSAVRDWLPMLYILAAYYLAGRTFVSPMPRVEAWLARIDRRVLGDHAALFARWPPALVWLLDAAYIGCFLLVPAGFAVLAGAGRRDLADRYWTIVMAAELLAFAPLPYLQTRPPWVIERLADAGPAARASVTFMKHATTGANTVPSGHAAGSLAVALAVIEPLPVIGAILLVLAIAIAVATIVTRAHFVVDVVSGVVLAVAVWMVVGEA